MPAHLVSPT